MTQRYYFAIVTIIVCIIFIIFFIALAWYWNRVANAAATATLAITASEATWLMWLSIIGAVISIGLLIYGIVVIVGLNKTTATNTHLIAQHEYTPILHPPTITETKITPAMPATLQYATPLYRSS